MRERATVVCWQNDRVLLVARQRGRWALPGGTIAHGETALEAVDRELAEETGLAGYLFEYLFQFGGLSKRHHVFQTTVPNDAVPKADNEIVRCRWFKVRKVSTLAASVPTRQIVELAICHRNVTIPVLDDGTSRR